ncbi:DUF2974 domain-containing protein [Enorma phocaeensis]|uniref:DUF2974 domain-containing protein n=1 Tax=Enorma phocaeensis TaxID=1871019 RepID=UPI000C82539B|nr:DUF2974 domain-containing protein [Enorma phocaeensis]
MAAERDEEARRAHGADAREGGTIVTYARTCLDTFRERPLGAVDSLILSWFAYFRLPSALLRDVPALTGPEGAPLPALMRAEFFDEMMGTSWDPEGSRELLCAACASPRFRTVRVALYRALSNEEREEQFAAVTFILPGGAVYVAFRGTDSTIVGWKEDFNMAFQSPVPAQVSAAAYLERVAGEYAGPLYVGGHSKGGNLAVYAAIMLPHAQQDRIVRAFSHDGPGFNENFLRGRGFARMRDRIDKTLPRSSVFGMIFEDQEDYSIVDSTSFALLQHNPFSWVVDGAEFRCVERISAGARYVDSTLASWMRSVTPEERGRFIDTVFDVIGAADSERFAQIRDNWQVTLPKMLAAAGDIDPETRQLIMRTIRALVKCATLGQAADAAARMAAAASDAAAKMAEHLPTTRPRL